MELSNAKIRYLLVIDALTQNEAAARSIDIAIRLGVARSSTHGMLESLASMGLVHKNPRRCVSLTAAGRRLAAGYGRQYRLLYSLFADLMELSPQEASESALAMVGNLPHGCLEKLCRRAPGGTAPLSVSAPS